MYIYNKDSSRNPVREATIKEYEAPSTDVPWCQRN